MDDLRERMMRAADAADQAALPGFPTGPMSQGWMNAFLAAIEQEGLRVVVADETVSSALEAFGPRKPKGCYLSTLELHELDEACKPFLSAFGTHPYLVGSASERPDFRDVDVRLILSDDEFDALFAERKGFWALLSRLGSTYLRAKTGLPIDFQVQRQTEANEKFGDLGKTPRNPLGGRDLDDFAGGGDAT